MSDLTPTPVTESAPAPVPVAEAPEPAQTSRDIVAETLADLEQADAAPTRPESTAQTEPAPVEPAREPTEAERLLAEHGIPADRRPDGREHRIPRSKVLKMIDSGLRKGREADAQRVQTIEQERDTLKADLAELARDLRGDPRQFVERIASIDPRYKDLLAGTPAEARVPAVPDDPEPEPDMPIRDAAGHVIGTTYSLEGMKKLREWDRRQFERLIESRVKPLAEREDAARKERDQAESQQMVRQHTQQQIAEAEAWPLFGKLTADTLTPFQAQVLTTLRTDREAAERTGRPMMSFRQAYLEVYAAHDDAAKRAAWAKELEQQPRSTAVTNSGPDAAKRVSPRTNREIVAETLAKLGG